MYYSAAGLLAAADVQAQAGQSASANPLITVVVFLLMLGLLVIVHELGHFLTALWMGIQVEEFGVGFPPRAVTLLERNGVKYTLNWLPLGGFVRFANGEGAKDTLYGVGSLAQAKPWRKIMVMVAGPLMNLLLAVVIFAIIFAAVGVPTPTGAQEISQVFAGTPAAQAGFQSGDQLIRLDGQSVEAIDTVIAGVKERPGTPIDAIVLRDGSEVTLQVTPDKWTAPDGTEYPVGFGFSYGPAMENKSVGLFGAATTGVTYTWDLLGRMLASLARIPAAFGNMFQPDTPSGEGPIGPVGIARATGEVIQQDGGFLGFWNLTAVLSLNLFLINLLPIPALDGSHIVFSLVEWLRGGKKVPPEKEALVHALGFAALMGLMLLVTVNDVMNAFSGVPVLGGG